MACSSSENRPQLPPADHLGVSGVGVTCEPRDLLDGYSRAGRQVDEGVAQFDVNSGQSERRLLNVRSAGKPGSSDSGSEAPRILQGPAVAVVIHISTGPFFHSFTGADLRLCPNYPQIYAQAVIVAGQKAAGEHESREEAVISRNALPSGGPEVTLMRIAC